MIRLALLSLLAACTGTSADSPADSPVDSPAEVEAEEPAAVEEITYEMAGEKTLTIRPIHHGTLTIRHAGTTWWVDPTKDALSDDAPLADVVLITDVHPDHLDKEALKTISTGETIVVAPEAVAKELGDAKVSRTMKNGDQAMVAGVSVTAVPMYNNTRGPEEGKLFHDKGRGNGYLLGFGDKLFYIAGDTACTEDMKKLTGIDHAFIPMNLPYTMPPTEAAECVKAFKPKVVTPYHYKGSDLTEFTSALEGVEGVTVQLADFYPETEGG